jgi:hypothetical protein
MNLKCLDCCIRQKKICSFRTLVFYRCGTYGGSRSGENTKVLDIYIHMHLARMHLSLLIQMLNCDSSELAHVSQ